MTSDEVGSEPAGALDLATEAVCVLDADGRFTYVNIAAEHLLGRGREELLGHVLFDALPELAATLFYTDLHRALLEREPVEAEEFFTPLGRWLLTRIRPVDAGVHVLFRDVTELRQLESERDDAVRAAQAAQALYRGFIAQSPDAIGRFELARPIPADAPEDEQLDFLYADAELAECNEPLARLYGFESAEEALGARLGSFLPGTDPLHLDALRRFIRAQYRLADAELNPVDGQEAARRLIAHLVGQADAGELLRLWLTVRPAAG